jgi:TPR repeat protein
MSNPFEEEYGETVRNFRLEAERGQAYAQFSLGLFYHTGLPGMPQDHVEAARLWRLGAAQGHVLAQYHGSRLYSEGKGVPLDHVEAARLLGLAAAQGHQEAQFELGCLYVQGKGVPQDPAEAGRLWWLAAAQGEDDAREGLKTLSCMREYVAACCMGCGATRKLKMCTKCKVARFCGAECQRRAWAEHRPHCKRWNAQAAA